MYTITLHVLEAATSVPSLIIA